jgi:hypothetical protein
MTWTTVGPSLITAAVAVGGILIGSLLTGRRETINWTRDQRVKAYAELLTAVDNCYQAFSKLAIRVLELEYAASAREDPQVKDALDDWRKWYREIDRRLPLVELVASERFIEYLPRFSGWRSHQLAPVIDLVHAKGMRPQEWESVHRRTIGDMGDVRRALRADLIHDSLGQRVSYVFWWFRRRLRSTVDRIKDR